MKVRLKQEVTEKEFLLNTFGNYDEKYIGKFCINDMKNKDLEAHTEF